jgi:hypothetical protein
MLIFWKKKSSKLNDTDNGSIRAADKRYTGTIEERQLTKAQVYKTAIEHH